MSGQIIDDYRIIPTKQLVRAIKEVNNRSERFCFILGSGASVSSGIPAGGELERRWMEELEKEPGLEDVRLIADKLKAGNHLEYDFHEIEDAWNRCKHTGSPLSSEYYFDIYKLRFFPNHRNGYHFLEELMSGAKPGFGYHPLALMLASDQGSNLVITTNFDSLVEDALFMYTDKKPLVINHELLADFAGDPNIRRPIIAKVHRGIFFDPLNRPEETNELKGKWHDVLFSVFQSYTPIVIGYGGGDNSLMELLSDQKLQMRNGIYWCYMEEYGLPNEKIQSLVQEKKGFLVSTAGFDATMLAIGNALFPDRIGVHETEQYLNAHTNSQIENYEKAYKKLTSYEDINKMPDGKRKDTPSEDAFRKEIDKIAARGTDSEARRERDNQMTAWDYRRQGMRHYDLSDYPRAYECFSLAISKQPDNAVFYNDRGYACVNLDNYKDALSDFNKALSLNPSFSQVYTGRGFAHLSQHKYEEAFADINTAIRLLPDDAQAYFCRGLAYRDLCRYEEALVDFNKTIELNPGHVQAYNNRGTVYHNLNDYEKALLDYNMAISLNPEYAFAYYNRGDLNHTLGKYEDALADYNMAISLKPDKAEFFNNRGALYNDMGKYDLALSDLDKAVVLNPDFANPYRHAGIAWEKKGDSDKAIQSYTKAIQLNPKYTEAYIDRARVYRALGNFEKAAEDEASSV